jgi:DNA-binding LacI/PurR family transcriptional regulator/DNA-binding transcriptional regulator YhcF (GntR family)
VQRVAGEIARLARQNPRERLPTSRALCSRLRCSARTLSAALASLRAGDAVRVVSRGGVFAGEIAASVPVGPAGPRPRHTVSWRRLRERIIADVATGTFAPGQQLPSAKQLCNRYGCCNRTLRAALASAAATKRVEAFRRGYRVPSIPARHGGGAVVVIAATKLMGILGSLTPRTAELWHCIESECLRANVELILDQASAVDETFVAGFAHKGHVLLGCLVMTAYMRPGDISHLLHVLGSAPVPVALLDETGNTAAHRAATSNRQFRFFLLGTGPESGRIVGDFLLRCSHRHAAFFQAVLHGPGRGDRVDGLRESFANAGLSDGVMTYSLEQYENEEAMYAGLDATPVTRFIRGRMGAVWSDPRVGANPEFMPFLPSHTDYLCRYAFFRERMRPYFEAALRDRAITAWVAYNDLLAFVALEFLRLRHVRLPERLSLVGFDDSLEAVGNGLASYNFNVNAIVHAMLEHVLGSAARRASCRETVEVPGFVVPRATAGVAPAAGSAATRQ